MRHLLNRPLQRRSGLLVIVSVLAILALGLGALIIGDGSGSVAGQPLPATTQTSEAHSSTSQPPETSSGEKSATSSEACTQANAIADMPIRDRLAQLLVVGVEAGSSDAALSVVRSEHVGGLFLPGDATGLLTGGALKQVRAASPIPPIVAVDDEGGRVQRVASLEGSIPSAREMAATMSPHEVYELARQRGQALAERGVTMDLAPVLDVSSQPDDAVIGDRSFSPDPAVVAEYGAAFARGLRDAGIVPVFKHFPGQGHAAGDSHKGTATTPALSELAEVDLVPYRKLLGRANATVMLGHLNVPGLTESGVPASLSPAAVRLLREEFGFDGLIMTDDLYAMDAVRDRYSLPEAARMALAAGADMALMISSAKLDAVLDHLEGAVADGTLSEERVNEAVAHVLRTKHVKLCDRD